MSAHRDLAITTIWRSASAGEVHRETGRGRASSCRPRAVRGAPRRGVVRTDRRASSIEGLFDCAPEPELVDASDLTHDARLVRLSCRARQGTRLRQRSVDIGLARAARRILGPITVTRTSAAAAPGHASLPSRRVRRLRAPEPMLPAHAPDRAGAAGCARSPRTPHRGGAPSSSKPRRGSPVPRSAPYRRKTLDRREVFPPRRASLRCHPAARRTLLARGRGGRRVALLGPAR